MLLLHGETDRCTPVNQAEQLYAALRRRGVETEMVIYPGEGHELREAAHQIDMHRRTCEWFDRHLPDANG